jgi:hypothetical protein
MSDTSKFPSNINLEYFRKQAKKLLRDCREGRAPAIARSPSVEEIIARIK